MTADDLFDVGAAQVDFAPSRGRVLNVTDDVAGTWLGADMTIGATAFTVETEVEVGDQFQFATGEVAVVATVAEDKLSGTFTLAVTNDHLEGEYMAAYPVLSYPVAMVSVSELDDDPVQALIPAALQPYLPEGPRTDANAEFVTIERRGDDERWWVAEVPGAATPSVANALGDMPVGSVIAYSADAPPPRWLLCDGQLVNRTTYADLFAVIGTTYGAGDGSTTFALPNLTDRFIRGHSPPGATGGLGTHDHGVGSYDLGQAGGHNHGISNHGGHGHGNGSMATTSSGGHSHPSAGGHDHTMGGSNANAGRDFGSSDVAATTHQHNINSASGHTHGSDGGHTHSVTGTTASGGDHDHGGNTLGASSTHAHGMSGTSGATTSLPPYLNLVFIIKVLAGGDPAQEGAWVEVRDEGVPDVPAAVTLDFRGAGVDVTPSGKTAVVTIGSQAGVTDHGALTGLADNDHPQYLVGTYPGGTTSFLRADGTWAAVTAGGGVTDHGALTGLSDNDHPQYALTADLAAHAAAADPHSVYTTQGEVDTTVATHLASAPHVAGHSQVHAVVSGDHSFPGGALFLRADGTWATPSGSSVFVNVRDYGAVGDGVTDDTAAINNAIASVSASNGATLFFPTGDYLVNTSALTGLPTGSKVLGAGRSTKVRVAAGTHNLWEFAAGVNSMMFENITFSVYSGGGHVFAPQGSFNRGYFLAVTATQNNPAKSIWKAPDAGFLDNKFEGCVFTHNGATSVPTFDFTAATASRYNSNTWERCQCNHTAVANSYFFDFATSLASDYNYDNTFRDLTMEFVRGGVARVRTGNNFLFDGINVYLEGNTTTADIFSFGKGGGGLASRAIALRNVHRKNGGGGLGASLNDVKLESGGGAFHIHFDNCNTSTLAGFVVDLGSNNNIDIKGCVNVTFNNPGATNNLRSEAGTTPSTQAFADAPSAGTSLLVAREDHKHGMPSAPAASGHTIKESGSTLTQRTNLDFTNGLLATDNAGANSSDVRADYGAVTAATTFGLASANGSSLQVARADHAHGTPANPVVPRTRSVFVTPDAMGGVSGATLTNFGTVPDIIRTREFSATAGESASAQFRIPDDWVPGTPIAIAVYWAPSAVGGNVQWSVGVSEVAAGANIVTTADATPTVVQAAAGSVVNGLNITVLSANMPTPSAAGSIVKVNVERQGANANDTATGTARLIGVAMQYSADS